MNISRKQLRAINALVYSAAEFPDVSGYDFRFAQSGEVVFHPIHYDEKRRAIACRPGTIDRKGKILHPDETV
jgi:hypothetical protein